MPIPVGRAHHDTKRSNNFLVLGSPASLIGSERQPPALRFAPLLCRKARPRQPSHNGGRHPRGSPIPLQASIIPPLGSYHKPPVGKILHLQHIFPPSWFPWCYNLVS